MFIPFIERCTERPLLTRQPILTVFRHQRSSLAKIGCRLTRFNNPERTYDLLSVPKTKKFKMSLAIRPLLTKTRGECALCKSQRELSSWDSNLAGRICEDCKPFLEAAEVALVAAKCGHPSDQLVFRNP